MIWVGGEIVPDDALKISVLDRTFEHGLGLFETLRTWNGRAVLLPRHLERMTNSAKVLRLPLDPEALPNHESVMALMGAMNLGSDALLRITMSGGFSKEVGGVVWMTAKPLPAPNSDAGAHLRLANIRTDWADSLSRHKTTNYWAKRMAYSDIVQGPGFGEALLMSPDGWVWEGTRSNLFAVRHGVLLTPPLQSPQGLNPLVPGIMRQVVLERASLLDIEISERNISMDSLKTASEVFLTNSVRGVMPVRFFDGRGFEIPAAMTSKIRHDVLGWLDRGGSDG
jgi:branched-chain amino acid aminotransferase